MCVERLFQLLCDESSLVLHVLLLNCVLKDIACTDEYFQSELSNDYAASRSLNVEPVPM